MGPLKNEADETIEKSVNQNIPKCDTKYLPLETLLELYFIILNSSKFW